MDQNDPSKLHPLLLRQLKKCGLDLDKIQEEWKPFIEIVGAAYSHYDEDRTLLERSMELSSHELTGVNERMLKDIESQKILLTKLREAIVVLSAQEPSKSSLNYDDQNAVLLIDLINSAIASRKKSEANMTALLNNTSDQIWSVNRSLELLSFNHAFSQKIEQRFHRKPTIGMSVDEVFGVSSKDSKIWKAYFQKALGGERFSHDRRYKEGETQIDLEISVCPIVSDNTIVGVTVFEKDISDRKKYEAEILLAKEAAESASRLKTEFLANMSHELRTPLNAIIGYSELIEEEAQGNNEVIQKDSNRITTAGKHLLAIINEILDLSKIEAGKMTVAVEKFSLRDLVEHLNSILDYLLKKNQNSYECLIQTDLKELSTDRPKLTQILFNLLGNAAKFTENGKVTLSVSDLKKGHIHGILFDVKDTGIGIPKEKQDRLFKAFSQADSSMSRKHEGTGLGLVIAQKFAQFLGGEITYKTKAGEGSTFSLWIPCVLNSSEENHG